MYELLDRLSPVSSYIIQTGKKTCNEDGEKGGIVLGSFCEAEWPPFFTPPSRDVGAKGTEGGTQTPSRPAPAGWAQRNPC